MRQRVCTNARDCFLTLAPRLKTNLEPLPGNFGPFWQIDSLPQAARITTLDGPAIRNANRGDSRESIRRKRPILIIFQQFARTCDSQFLATKTAIRQKGVQFRNPSARVYPHPSGAGSARPNPKMGAPDPENPLFVGLSVLRGGLRPMVSDHGLGRGQTMG